MTLFKKRKKESVAIPFLISMIVTLLVVGIPVLKFYNSLISQKEANESNMSMSVFSPSEKNDTTILFTFSPEDKALRSSFMILKTSALDKSFIFIPVSNDLLCGSEKMSDVFNRGGIIELKKAVETTLDTKIDRYMALDKNGLSLIVDSIGGVNYNIPDGLKGLNEGTQFLDSDLIMKLISNKKFAEDTRTVTTASVFAEMISSASGSRMADTVDYTYKQLVNISETDITSIDYIDQKKAIEYILRSNQFKSTFRIPSGESTENGISMSKSDIAQLKTEAGLK